MNLEVLEVPTEQTDTNRNVAKSGSGDVSLASLPEMKSLATLIKQEKCDDEQVETLHMFVECADVDDDCNLSGDFDNTCDHETGCWEATEVGSDDEFAQFVVNEHGSCFLKLDVQPEVGFVSAFAMY